MHGCDYHWYRQNPDGTWSHKPGNTPVTNLDYAETLIYDPNTANRVTTSQGLIYDYCYVIGYYSVTPLNNLVTSKNSSAFDEDINEEFFCESKRDSGVYKIY